MHKNEKLQSDVQKTGRKKLQKIQKGKKYREQHQKGNLVVVQNFGTRSK